jgi:DNA-binding IclR family transcriptional regulator
MPPEPPDRERQVLDQLQGGPRTTRALLEALAWSRSTLRDVLARMVLRGSVLRIAESPRSPEQAYRLP